MIREKVLVNCCFACEKGFYSNSNLNRHFRTVKHNCYCSDCEEKRDETD